MPTLQTVILVVFSICLSVLVVMAFSWINKNKHQHPQLYKNMGLIRFVIWLVLNLRDVF